MRFAMEMFGKQLITIYFSDARISPLKFMNMIVSRKTEAMGAQLNGIKRGSSHLLRAKLCLDHLTVMAFPLKALFCIICLVKPLILFSDFLQCSLRYVLFW